MQASSSWACAECTFDNDSSASACAACNTTCPALLRALADDSAGAASKNAKGNSTTEKKDKPKPEAKPKDGPNAPVMSFMNHELWAHGVFVMRAAIDPMMQRELLADYTAATQATDYGAGGLQNGRGTSAGPTKFFSYSAGMKGAGGRTVAPACMELAANLFKQARNGEVAELADAYNAAQICKELRVPSSFKPSTAMALGYGEASTLGFHKDGGHTAWVFIINLGRSVDFAYSRGAPRGEKTLYQQPHTPIDDADDKLEQGLVHTVCLKSGDAILFNGQHLYHAVTRIHGLSSQPLWWSAKDFVRIGLQMREMAV